MSDKFSEYAHPEALVSTEWLAAHLDDPIHPRRREQRGRPPLRHRAHPARGAHRLAPGPQRPGRSATTLRPRLLPRSAAVMASRLRPTVIFYGDKSNWWACYAFWVFQLFDHVKAKVVDGGRAKWIAEGRPLTKEVPIVSGLEVSGSAGPARRRKSARFMRRRWPTRRPADRWSMCGAPKEFTGELTHMPEYPQEGVLRGGHIPGAKSCPWATAANADGTFKTAAELRQIYTQ